MSGDYGGGSDYTKEQLSAFREKESDRLARIPIDPKLLFTYIPEIIPREQNTAPSKNKSLPNH